MIRWRIHRRDCNPWTSAARATLEIDHHDGRRKIRESPLNAELGRDGYRIERTEHVASKIAAMSRVDPVQKQRVL